MAAKIAIMLAGPNGAGKTTTAKTLFQECLRSVPFVNADIIAQGLSGGDPDSVALEAGAIMLRRLHQLADDGKDLAFETTGASRTFAPWIRELQTKGFEFHLYFFWLNSADVAISRVADRVRHGGHDVPAETIRRRYDSGLRNVFRLYSPLATTWQLSITLAFQPQSLKEG
jgi:predicted ABC-type ATPase